MKANGLKSQRGYRKPRANVSTPSIVARNTLDRQFNPTQPNQLWVTDITYIRTHEGWLYLAVVIDLFSRLVVGWSMKSRITTDLVLDALLMALWRRSPKNKVLIHSDQGSQYTSHEWQTFLKHHNLESSMSRRGNCHDNAVAESFFQLLKRERIKKKIYVTRTEARSDIFEYIEMFYNSKRRHGSNGQRSPLDYEKAHQKMVMCVQNFGGYSGSYENLLKATYLYTRSEAEVLKMYKYIVFNCLIGNGDAHLKNFALQYTPDMSDIFVSPPFDITHTLIYKNIDDQLALKISGSKRFPTKAELLKLAETPEFRIRNAKEIIEYFSEQITDYLKSSNEVQYFGGLRESNIKHGSEVYNKDTICSCHDYDIYITGSDQV